ncbi:MAG TPA: iron ABC transporter permease [Thermotogota bacterium]|nr:iron ABC transporter permease [Thermotogota bacterium]HPJ88857.1 iron ABC transporter permease [Thermotogota bacterium]HPR97226.1 iron ABC transporter permease [Thermotogota bacterium]
MKKVPAKTMIPSLLIAAVIMFLLAISIGTVNISIGDILRSFFNSPEVKSVYKKILFDIRIPRALMALLVGMMLSSSGTVVQAVFQNPLAEPYIIGISASAVFGAVIAFLLGLPDFYYGVFAFVVSILVSFTIFKLANFKGKVNTSTLLIIGIAVSSFLGAFTSFAMYAIGEDSYRIMVWTMGYLGGATWGKIGLLAIPLTIAICYFLFYRNDLDAIMMGEQEAHSLGIKVARLKKRLLVVSCLIVSFSVAFTGMIGFVGLIIPHTMRMLMGYSNSKLLVPTTIAGGVFLLFSDTIARNILAPTEVPIGVITSFFGAPFFIYLAFRAKKGGAEHGL